MRVSTNQQWNSTQSRIAAAAERLAILQQQATTGRRINSLSDDPAGSAKVITLNSALAANDQYGHNIGTSKALLQTTDSALDAMATMIRDVRSAVVQGANGSLDPQARAALAADVKSKMDSFVERANGAAYLGRYVFSGQRTDQKPLSVAGGIATYNGDSNPVNIEVSSGQTMQVNLPGSPLLTDIYSTLEQVRADLEAGNTPRLSNEDLDLLQERLDSVLNARAGIGSKIKELTDLETQTSRRTDDLKQILSDTQDVDITQAITDLRGAELAYQASLTVASRSFGLSLMDFIRGG